MIDHLLNALGAIGNVLDLPGSSVRDVLALHNPFDQWLSPLSTKNRISGRDLLRHHGLIGNEDNWGNFAGGLAAETALDPLNFVGGSLLKRAFARHAAVSAENSGIRSANAVSQGQRAAGFFPEELLAHQHPSNLTEHGLPVKQYHGTAAVFDKFDPLKDSGDNLYGPGFYHTDAPDIGSSYAKGPGRHMSEAGLPPEHHVRMAYLDVRNPLDVRGHAHSLADFPRATEFPKIQEAIDLHRQRIRQDIQAARSAKTRLPSADDIISPQREYQNAVDLLRESLPHRNRVPMAELESLGGAEHIGEIARQNNFDSLVHEGGRNVGNQLHNVTVAFNPEQVYKPYIAKALQAEKKLPSSKPIRIGLAAYATTSRARGQE